MGGLKKTPHAILFQLSVRLTVLVTFSFWHALAAESEMPAPHRLQVLQGGMNNLRVISNGLREELSNLQKNVTLLTNLTR